MEKKKKKEKETKTRTGGEQNRKEKWGLNLEAPNARTNEGKEKLGGGEELVGERVERVKKRLKESSTVGRVPAG